MSLWEQVTALTIVEWVQVASAIGTALAAVVAMFAAKAASRSANIAEQQLPEVRRQVDAANRQNELQHQLRVDSMQPNVWVDMRPQEDQAALLILMVGNSGPTIARNVRVTVEAQLPAVDFCRERLDLAMTSLARGLPSSTPGRTLTWPLGQSFNIITDEDEQKFTFTVDADGPYGPLDQTEFVIDLADWRGSMT